MEKARLHLQAERGGGENLWVACPAQQSQERAESIQHAGWKRLWAP